MVAGEAMIHRVARGCEPVPSIPLICCRPRWPCAPLGHLGLQLILTHWHSMPYMRDPDGQSLLGQKGWPPGLVLPVVLPPCNRSLVGEVTRIERNTTLAGGP